MYFLVRYLKVPKDPTRTSEKGYVKDPENMALDEQVSFSRNLKKNDVREYNVILSLFDQKIVKCSVDELVGSDFNTAFAYYYKNYKTYFDRLFEAVGVKLDQVNSSGATISNDVENITSSEPTLEEKAIKLQRNTEYGKMGTELDDIAYLRDRGKDKEADMLEDATAIYKMEHSAKEAVA